MLLSLFSLFSSPPAVNDRRCLLSHHSLSSSTITSLLLPLLPPLFLSRDTHPLARLQLRGPFSPSNSSLFLLRCSAPSPSSLYLAYRLSAPFPASPTSTDARARVLFIRVAPRVLSPLFFLSFFLPAPLALPVVSNFAKGWRRECAPRPSRGGGFLFAAACFHPSPPASYSIRFRSFLAPLFSLLAYARCGRAIGKSIDCEQRAPPCALVGRDIYRSICGVNGPRSLSARRSHDRPAIPRYTLTYKHR